MNHRAAHFSSSMVAYVLTCDKPALSESLGPPDYHPHHQSCPEDQLTAATLTGGHKEAALDLGIDENNEATFTLAGEPRLWHAYGIAALRTDLASSLSGAYKRKAAEVEKEYDVPARCATADLAQAERAIMSPTALPLPASPCADESLPDLVWMSEETRLAWLQQLACCCDLQEQGITLAIPSFTTQQDLFHALWRSQLPLARATWLVRVVYAHWVRTRRAGSPPAATTSSLWLGDSQQRSSLWTQHVLEHLDALMMGGAPQVLSPSPPAAVSTPLMPGMSPPPSRATPEADGCAPAASAFVRLLDVLSPPASRVLPAAVESSVEAHGCSGVSGEDTRRWEDALSAQLMYFARLAGHTGQEGMLDGSQLVEWSARLLALSATTGSSGCSQQCANLVLRLLSANVQDLVCSQLHVRQLVECLVAFLAPASTEAAGGGVTRSYSAEVMDTAVALLGSIVRGAASCVLQLECMPKVVLLLRSGGLKATSASENVAGGGPVGSGVLQGPSRADVLQRMVDRHASLNRGFSPRYLVFNEADAALELERAVLSGNATLGYQQLHLAMTQGTSGTPDIAAAVRLCCDMVVASPFFITPGLLPPSAASATGKTPVALEPLLVPRLLLAQHLLRRLVAEHLPGKAHSGAVACAAATAPPVHDVHLAPGGRDSQQEGQPGRGGSTPAVQVVSLPPSYRALHEYIVDWLDDVACDRRTTPSSSPISGASNGGGGSSGRVEGRRVMALLGALVRDGHFVPSLYLHRVISNSWLTPSAAAGERGQLRAARHRRFLHHLQHACYNQPVPRPRTTPTAVNATTTATAAAPVDAAGAAPRVPDPIAAKTPAAATAHTPSAMPATGSSSLHPIPSTLALPAPFSLLCRSVLTRGMPHSSSGKRPASPSTREQRKCSEKRRVGGSMGEHERASQPSAAHGVASAPPLHTSLAPAFNSGGSPALGAAKSAAVASAASKRSIRPGSLFPQPTLRPRAAAVQSAALHLLNELMPADAYHQNMHQGQKAAAPSTSHAQPATSVDPPLASATVSSLAQRPATAAAPAVAAASPAAAAVARETLPGHQSLPASSASLLHGALSLDAVAQLRAWEKRLVARAVLSHVARALQLRARCTLQPPAHAVDGSHASPAAEPHGSAFGTALLKELAHYSLAAGKTSPKEAAEAAPGGTQQQGKGGAPADAAPPPTQQYNVLGSAWLLQVVALLEALDAAAAASLVLLVLLAEVVGDKLHAVRAAVQRAAGGTTSVTAQDMVEVAVTRSAAGAVPLDLLGIAEGTILAAVEASQGSLVACGLLGRTLECVTGWALEPWAKDAALVRRHVGRLRQCACCLAAAYGDTPAGRTWWAAGRLRHATVPFVAELQVYFNLPSTASAAHPAAPPSTTATAVCRDSSAPLLHSAGVHAFSGVLVGQAGPHKKLVDRLGELHNATEPGSLWAEASRLSAPLSLADADSMGSTTADVEVAAALASWCTAKGGVSGVDPDRLLAATSALVVALGSHQGTAGTDDAPSPSPGRSGAGGNSGSRGEPGARTRAISSLTMRELVLRNLWRLAGKVVGLAGGPNGAAADVLPQQVLLASFHHALLTAVALGADRVGGGTSRGNTSTLRVAGCRKPAISSTAVLKLLLGAVTHGLVTLPDAVDAFCGGSKSGAAAAGSSGATQWSSAAEVALLCKVALLGSHVQDAAAVMDAANGISAVTSKAGGGADASGSSGSSVNSPICCDLGVLCMLQRQLPFDLVFTHMHELLLQSVTEDASAREAVAAVALVGHVPLRLRLLGEPRALYQRLGTASAVASAAAAAAQQAKRSTAPSPTSLNPSPPRLPARLFVASLTAGVVVTATACPSLVAPTVVAQGGSGTRHDVEADEGLQTLSAWRVQSHWLHLRLLVDEQVYGGALQGTGSERRTVREALDLAASALAEANRENRVGEVRPAERAFCDSLLGALVAQPALSVLYAELAWQMGRTVFEYLVKTIDWLLADRRAESILGANSLANVMLKLQRDGRQQRSITDPGASLPEGVSTPSANHGLGSNDAISTAISVQPSSALLAESSQQQQQYLPDPFAVERAVAEVAVAGLWKSPAARQREFAGEMIRQLARIAKALDRAPPLPPPSEGGMVPAAGRTSAGGTGMVDGRAATGNVARGASALSSVFGSQPVAVAVMAAAHKSSGVGPELGGLDSGALLSGTMSLASGTGAGAGEEAMLVDATTSDAPRVMTPSGATTERGPAVGTSGAAASAPKRGIGGGSGGRGVRRLGQAPRLAGSGGGDAVEEVANWRDPGALQVSIWLRLWMLLPVLPLVYQDKEVDTRKNLRAQLAPVLMQLLASPYVCPLSPLCGTGSDVTGHAEHHAAQRGITATMTADQRSPAAAAAVQAAHLAGESLCERLQTVLQALVAGQWPSWLHSKGMRGKALRQVPVFDGVANMQAELVTLAFGRGRQGGERRPDADAKVAGSVGASAVVTGAGGGDGEASAGAGGGGTGRRDAETLRRGAGGSGVGADVAGHALLYMQTALPCARVPLTGTTPQTLGASVAADALPAASSSSSTTAAGGLVPCDSWYPRVLDAAAANARPPTTPPLVTMSALPGVIVRCRGALKYIG